MAHNNRWDEQREGSPERRLGLRASDRDYTAWGRPPTTIGSSRGYTRPAWEDPAGGYGESIRRDRGFGPHVGRGPRGYQRPDERIREEVCDRLTDAPDVDASDIDIEVTNGEVTLRGSTSSREEKRRAEDIADNISGVRDVHNQIRVALNESRTLPELNLTGEKVT
jgi:hypothetical protein